MAWYNAGTVAVALNSTTVTGTGTAWTDNVDAGQAFIGPDGQIYQIASVVSATSITLATAYRSATASAQPYAIMPVQGYLRDLALQAAQLVLSFATVRDGIGAGKFPDGTVGAPGSRFANDEDTGWYRPGANQLGLVTNGTERVRIDADGYAIFYNLAKFADGTAALPGITFNADPDTGFWRPGANLLGLVTNGTERMRVDASGNVGIGTSNPGSRLHVNGTLRLDSGTADGPELTLASAGYPDWNNDSINGRWRLFQNSTERVCCDANGNFGIGTSSPGYKLDVNGIVMLSNGMSYAQRNSSGAWAAGTAGAQMSYGSDNNVYYDNYQGAHVFRSASYAQRFIVEASGLVRPGSDNAQTLGSSSYRWSVVYAGTGTINTSDERAKQDIGSIPDEWLDAWGTVEWVRYKFKDAIEAKAADARWHVGLIAQHVRDAFAALDLDATEIGLLCYDQWNEEREPIFEERQIDTETVIVDRIDTGLLDANGEPVFRDVTEDRPIMGMVDTGETRVTLEAGDRWGLRYDECQAMEAAWQRREIAKGKAVAEARLSTLETLAANQAAEIAALQAAMARAAGSGE